jgi:integrase/recombinase XerD
VTILRQSLADYLKLRRALGYKLERPEKLLGQFIDYLETLGADTVTTEAAISWARLPEHGGSNWWASRLSVVRGFTAYLQTVDPAAEIPAADLLAWRPRRASPYLYTDDEINALIDAATALRFSVRVATYQTLIGLLAVTGMRVGEAIRLDRDDFDPANGILTVRWTKFDKTRELPLHPTTTAAVAGYLALRDKTTTPTVSPALLVSPAGTRLLYCNVHSTFKILAGHAGLKPRSPSCRPRIHDLRHSFAVRALLDAYKHGQDPQARLAQLATYLGHVNPAGTYWYLSAAPELLALAADRLDMHRAPRR